MTSKKGRNVAGSHRAKLLTLARDSGEDFQFLLGRWVVRAFPMRLAGSAQKDSFVLKGAMLFFAWRRTSSTDQGSGPSRIRQLRRPRRHPSNW